MANADKTQTRIPKGIPPEDLDPLQRAIFPHGVLGAWIQGVSEQGPVDQTFETGCSIANRNVFGH